MDTENPFESMENVLVFDPRDWGQLQSDAWLWGIICGWDDESLQDLAVKHRWSDDTVSRLKRLRSAFVAAQPNKSVNATEQAGLPRRTNL